MGTFLLASYQRTRFKAETTLEGDKCRDIEQHNEAKSRHALRKQFFMILNLFDKGSCLNV